MANPTASEITVAGCRINVLRAGQGAPVLYLHGAGGLEWFPGLTDLSARYEIIAPEHPGFGKSEMPDWLDTMGDLSFFYLDVLDALNLHDVHVMGHSMGGWLAAEMAIRNTLRIKSLTLIAAAGLRVDGAEVGDFFMWPPEQIIRNLYLDQRHADEILATPRSEEHTLTPVTATSRMPSSA